MDNNNLIKDSVSTTCKYSLVLRNENNKELTIKDLAEPICAKLRMKFFDSEFIPTTAK